MTCLTWLAVSLITLIVGAFGYAILERLVHGDPLPHEGDAMLPGWRKR